MAPLRGLLACLGLALAAMASPTAPASAADVDFLTEDAGDALRAGEYLWSGADRANGPVTIVISVASQRAYVYRGPELLGISTVSTGRRGHSTPLGGFEILEKRLFHRSNLYSNAPMPFMQRLTWSGVALHAGVLPGYPASHGCIRLPRSFAARLFGTTAIGSAVIVTDYDARLSRHPLPVADASSPRLEFAAVWADEDDEGEGTSGAGGTAAMR